MWVCVTMVCITSSSCSTEAVAQDVVTMIEIPEDHKIESNTFTVVWESNQVDPYVEFNKHVFRDCEVVSTITEIHREKRFEITLDDFQKFDLHIRKTSPVKNPELYIAIYRGDVLQYEQEFDTAGFVYIGYVDELGNLGE